MILKKYTSIIWSFIALSLLCTFLVFSSTASESARQGILLCINVIAPTLFPIFVINGLLISSGAADKIADLVSKPIQKLFGVSRDGVYPVIIGIVCGAPSGCIALSGVLEYGDMTSDEASIIALCSSPISFSFLYGAVGGRMLSDKRLGIVLFFIGVISSAISGRMISLLLRTKIKAHGDFSPSNHEIRRNVPSVSSSLNNAVSSIISVCGAIVFFSAVSGVICSIKKLPFFVRTASSIFLEISSGARTVTDAMSSRNAFLYLCAGVGWSGVSIICQCLSSAGRKVNTRLFLLGKCLCSLICLLLGMIALLFGLI